MEKARRCYDREFKISEVTELESGKPLAQIAREQGIHPSLLFDGAMNSPRIPKERTALIATGASTKPGSTSLRGCEGRLLPRTSFKKKSLRIQRIHRLLYFAWADLGSTGK